MHSGKVPGQVGRENLFICMWFLKRSVRKLERKQMGSPTYRVNTSFPLHFHLALKHLILSLRYLSTLPFPQTQSTLSLPKTLIASSPIASYFLYPLQSSLSFLFVFQDVDRKVSTTLALSISLY